MAENDKLGDIGLVYGDYQVISTPRMHVEPTTAELAGLRIKKDGNEDEA